MMSITALVTGTDHGLGAALAAKLAGQGARVFAGALKLPLSTANPESVASGGSIQRLELDVACDRSVTAALAVVRQATDHLDIIINNAAILGDISRTAFDGLDFDEMLRVYNVNALGGLRVSQACLPLLMAGKSPLIVNISSEAGSIADCQRRNWYAYAMSKSALNMQSALLHNLISPRGGRVLVLHPGHVRTFMQGKEDLSANLTPEQAADRVLANIARYLADPGQRPAPRPAFLGPNGELLPW
jgi:NAD(P)-dependent dehydrogenase (short-subunit alcohol dehydrogenase family)